VSSQLSVAKVLANLEAQMAFHKEREAFHAEQEVFHRGQRPPGRRPQHRKNTDGQGRIRTDKDSLTLRLQLPGEQDVHQLGVGLAGRPGLLHHLGYQEA
jgi:hypothetical protein